MPSQRSNPGAGSGNPKFPGSFLLAFREAVGQVNWQTRRWLGSAVECVDEAGKEQVVGLENLFRRLRREDRSTWPALIVAFLQSVPAAPEEALADLPSVADKLLVRLGPPFPRNQEDASIWYLPLIPNIIGSSLVVDFPNSMAYVSDSILADSGQPTEHWLERALANLHARTPADCLELVDDETGLRQCTAGDAYDSSRALLLDRLFPAEQTYGHFVILPSRDVFMFLPVNEETLNRLPALKLLAAKNFQSAPYPISDDVFWVRRGQWSVFRIQINGNNVAVAPPEEFAEILEKLLPEDEQDANEGPPPQ